MENNYFERLYAVNCNGQTEKKNGLTYLSWAWAWAEVKKQFPDANYTVYEDATGCIYHTDGRSAWVKTGMTVNGIEHIEYLPVMDNRNKSIPVEQITSFDANKAIQRSLTKAAARHGLGLYIYAGEDLPEEEVKAAADEQSKLDAILNSVTNAETANAAIASIERLSLSPEKTRSAKNAVAKLGTGRYRWDTETKQFVNM